MMWCNVWCDRRGKTQPEWMELACQVLRSELKVWEDKHVSSNREHKHTYVQKLTPAHFGTPVARDLKLKAAETKTFFNFLVAKVRTVSAQLHNGDLWLGASNAMDKLLRLLKSLPWKLSTAEHQELLGSCPFSLGQRNTTNSCQPDSMNAGSQLFVVSGLCLLLACLSCLLCIV